jgi:hypothetical protein
VLEEVKLFSAPDFARSRPGGRGTVLGAAFEPMYTSLVKTGVMRTTNKTVRRSVSLPATIAAQVRSMAKSRRLSSNRMLVDLIENGIEAEKRKQQEFFDLAERFRGATDPDEVKRLGDQLGRMVFGD